MEAVIVGGGHNGLAAACYLAQAGVEVLVLEQSNKLGGGSRTDELIPGYKFNTHSAAHNIINATDVVDELKLRSYGLEYREMDPFSIAAFADGRMVRFYRDVDKTIASIAEIDRGEAELYRSWMHDAMPVVSVMRAGLEGGVSASKALRQLPGRLAAAVQGLARNGGPLGLGQMLVSPYGRILDERLGSDLVRAPVSAFAAHTSASPDAPGGATFALWQAFYHQVGQWHAVGGSQGLTDSLTRRLESLGGTWRTDAAVERIVRENGRVEAVILETGERIEASNVITAIDPGVTLLKMLDPPLVGREAERLRSTHRSNSVQMLVHLATTSLPQYPNARPGDWNGLQSYVDTVESLSNGFAQAQAFRLPADPVPTYTFTPSALDDSLAPTGHHTVYLACPSAPYQLEGGWESQKQAFAERMIDTVERRAPGFRDTIVGMAIRTPEDMAAELRWPGAHPMYLDISLDQLAFMRPTRKLSNHRTEVEGLFISGAGTSPVGGIAATPGRAAAKALLKHRKR